MSNTTQELVVTSDLMQKASAVGPMAALKSVQLTNVNAMLGNNAETVAKYVRHARTHSFDRIGDGELEVSIRFTLDIATTEEEKSEPPISMEGRYVLKYAIEGMATLDDEHLQAFAQINGYFNAWPFWRELTTSMIARTKSAFFILPTLRVAVTKDAASPPTEG